MLIYIDTINAVRSYFGRVMLGKRRHDVRVVNKECRLPQVRLNEVTCRRNVGRGLRKGRGAVTSNKQEEKREPTN